MADNDMKQKLAAWLSGRNGADELAICAGLLALVLIVLNMFLRSMVISIIAFVLMGYAWFRMFSRNLEARENENGVFVEFLGPLRQWVRNPGGAFSEARSYKHFSCSECGQRVRVPRGKGKIRVTCPKCGNKFEART